MIIALTVVSCKKNEVTSTEKTPTTESGTELYSCPSIPKYMEKKGKLVLNVEWKLTEPVVEATPAVEVVKEVEIIKSKSSFSVDAILDDYLKLKNALTKMILKGLPKQEKNCSLL